MSDTTQSPKKGGKEKALPLLNRKPIKKMMTDAALAVTMSIRLGILELSFDNATHVFELSSEDNNIQKNRFRGYSIEQLNIPHVISRALKGEYRVEGQP